MSSAHLLNEVNENHVPEDDLRFGFCRKGFGHSDHRLSGCWFPRCRRSGGDTEELGDEENGQDTPRIRIRFTQESGDDLLSVSQACDRVLTGMCRIDEFYQ